MPSSQPLARGSLWQRAAAASRPAQHGGERVRAHVHACGAEGTQSCREHLILLGGRLRVCLQQRQHYRIRRLLGHSPVQQLQPTILRSAAASERLHTQGVRRGAARRVWGCSGRTWPLSLAASGCASSSTSTTASDACLAAARCSGSHPFCAVQRRASESARTHAARCGAEGAWSCRAHLIRLLGGLQVRLQQRRHHRLRRLVGRGPVQRQPPLLRSAAASE